jgi:hypothetical protein
MNRSHEVVIPKGNIGTYHGPSRHRYEYIWEFKPEVTTWLDGYIPDDNLYVYSQTYDSFVFLFSDKDDALLFKLTWGGV